MTDKRWVSRRASRVGDAPVLHEASSIMSSELLIPQSLARLQRELNPLLRFLLSAQ
jgi:hypothetical protein